MMTDYPIYENDAAIAEQFLSRSPDNIRSGSGILTVDKYPNMGSHAAYRQQAETCDIYLTSINRTQSSNHSRARREIRRQQAISLYDENNYALAGPISRSSSEVEVDESDPNRILKCYKGHIKKRWILLVAFITSVICTIIVIVINTFSKEKDLTSRNFPIGKQN